MKFRLVIQNIYFRCLGIIGSPKEEWIKIREENNSIRQLLISFILLLMLITALASIIGGYIHRDGKHWSSALLVIAGLKPVLTISVSLWSSILAITPLIKTYGGKADPEISSKLVFFSSLPLILVTIVLGMEPELYLLGLFSLYLFYIMHFGVQELTEIPSEKRSNFSTLASTMILVIYLIANFILSAIFGAIH